MNDVRVEARVETPLGALKVKVSTDPAHPGIWIDLGRPDFDCDLALALVEFSSDDADFPDGEPHIITHVWGNGEKEDYTTRVVHEGIEEYFEIQEADENE